MHLDEGHNAPGSLQTFFGLRNESHSNPARSWVGALRRAGKVASRQHGHIVLSHQVARETFVVAARLKGSYKMTMELPMEVYRNAIMNRPVPSDLASAFGATPFSRPATAAPSTDAPAGNASDPSGRAVFKAVEKLGLKLDSRKAPIETLIIEHVDKNPTEN